MPFGGRGWEDGYKPWGRSIGASGTDSRRASTGAIDGPSVKISIGFSPEVGKQMMAAASLAFGA